ncbi:hypothetical protein MNBD_PLANCTO03-1088 [hydrothermal vent metagenome]|uniref:Uncharacterized protein n=1 Tax=hydrothermal vent metagenome TaxID=652676 RepID=A0A3B1E8K8_9ZZZZ
MSPSVLSAAKIMVCSGIFAGAGSMANAQFSRPDDGEPIIVGEQEGWNPFKLHSFEAAINAQARWRSFRRSTPGQPDQTSTEQYLLGRFDLFGEAFIGHENLLDINGHIGFGLEERDLDSDIIGASRNDTDLLLLYDVSALILSEGPAPLTLYSRRNQLRLEREFSGTIDSLNTEHGAMVRIKSTTLPTYIHLFRREIDQSDQIGVTDYRITQDSLSVRTTPVLGDDQELSIEYTLDLVDERQSRFYENSYTRHDAQVIHAINFGGEKEHNLRSIARFYDESGASALRRYRLDETLRLEHTKRFDTRYDFAFEDAVRGDQWQRYLRGAGQARYKLFDSLIAIGRLGADRLDISGDFSSRQYSADIDLQYTKRVPLGRFDATLGGGLNRQENSEQGQPIRFNDQRIILNDPTPTIINRRNVVAGSIVVTDVVGMRVYLEGIDYTIVVFPSHIEVRRIVGGAITEGESLLVDYTVGPEPASTIDSVNARFSIRYTIEEGPLNGLSAYLNYIRIDQSVETVDPTRFILEDVKDLRYGLDYRIGQVTLQAERRNHDSTIFPYDTTRLEGRYDIRLGPRGSLSASVSHEISDYPANNDQRTLSRATIRARGRLGNDFDLGLRLLYRDESSRLANDLTGFEQSLEVTWRRGRTVLSASVYNSILDGQSSESQSQTLTLGIRRTF